MREGVPGDLIETACGVGGATILMRAVLRTYGITDRCVWVSDSFAGVPPSDAERFAADSGDRLHMQPALAWTSRRSEAISAYRLLDDQVRFLPGWFRDTLPTLSQERWAVVRLDGDLYESTMQGLEHLCPALSTGGYLIVDDHGAMPPCKQAVDDFRAARDITERLQEIDWTGVFWRKG